ncbi:hypothetical protein [Streptomyces olivaceus]|uniref:hypothetical protein n=1 Tax=Streptomyces olivaceus TaxID=47716 RepID=UPI001CC92404|nr:hypothetical protein [Streptomyces olivaceus]
MTGELSAVGLARQALIVARKAAKKNGATTRKPAFAAAVLAVLLSTSPALG